jgi:hypothetical protein
MLLEHLGEFIGSAAPPIIIHDEEVGLLHAEAAGDLSEYDGFDFGRRRNAENVGIPSGGDLRRRGRLDEHRHLVFHQLRHDGERCSRCRGAHQHGYLVADDELLSDRRRFRRVAPGVLHQKLELAAEHAAGSVNFLGRDLCAIDHVGAGRGEGPGQRLDQTDLDG